jgi:acyl dehydratase
MKGSERLAMYVETEKQRRFERDFLTGWEEYETWDTVEIGPMGPAARDYLVEEEDVLSYNRACGETDPLMVDPKYARTHSPTGKIVPHPGFYTSVCFYCISPKGRGTWIRTPGARNPFQKIEIVEPMFIGERIAVTVKTEDRWIQRGKHYLTNLFEFRAADRLKARAWGTLILPPTREDIRKFATA